MGWLGGFMLGHFLLYMNMISSHKGMCGYNEVNHNSADFYLSKVLLFIGAVVHLSAHMVNTCAVLIMYMHMHRV